MDVILDVLIVGAGPIGINCGLACQKKGLQFLIVEKDCLLHSIYNYPHQMRFFSSADLLELENIPFISNEVKPNREEALAYYRRIAFEYKLPIKLFEEVTSIKPDKKNYKVCSTKNQYIAKNIILATGFFDIPNQLEVPGGKLPKVIHYFHDPHYYAGQKVAVIGASNSAVDAALACYRANAEVTLIIRDKAIGNRVKYWVKPDIENRIAEGKIKAYFNAQVAHIENDFLQIQQKNKVITLPNHFVLAMIGYRPNFQFLQEVGIYLSHDDLKKPTYNADTMETNIKSIYLAGVVCGGMETHKWFIENSRIHAEKIISHIHQKNNSNKA